MCYRTVQTRALSLRPNTPLSQRYGLTSQCLLRGEYIYAEKRQVVIMKVVLEVKGQGQNLITSV